VEYEMSVSFNLPENGSNLKSDNKPNALISTLLPDSFGDSNQYLLEVSRYDTSQVALPEASAPKEKSEFEIPYALILVVIVIIVVTVIYLRRKGRSRATEL
jgi:hypothetical protein